MGQILRWGILGTGNIAHKFATQLGKSPRAKLVAVGSRTAEKAQAFAAEFGADSGGDYEALLASGDVDAVYLSLPNTLHHRWTLAALAAGKHVLCEKPIAANAGEAEEMFDAAKQAGRTLVEAFMYRCHPAVERVLELVRGSAIGDVRLIRTHFTFNRADDPNDVRYQSALAGGSLMDVGCYCINFARALAGAEPTDVHVAVHRHATGVDDYAVGLLDFGGSTLATFTCGMTVTADRTTYIGGSEGYVAIEFPWFSEGRFTLVTGDNPQTFDLPAPMPPYALEADCFAAAVFGEADPWIRREDSLGNMRVLDTVRRTLGSA